MRFTLPDEVTESLSVLQDDDYILKGIRTIDLSRVLCIRKTENMKLNS
jgi:hypothetical protein